MGKKQILLLVFYFFSCQVRTDYVTRELTIWNKYVSNSYDNYEDQIEVNFRLESQGWFWLYGPGDRPKIYSNGSRKWEFQFLEELDSVYVHARFFHTKDVTPQIVYADTTFRMNSDKTLVFWNCGDSTVTAYPFPACLNEMEAVTRIL